MAAGGLLLRRPARGQMRDIRALTFDVFGTVVDWRSSITSECRQRAGQKNWKVDCEAFADAWRGGYGPSMGKVRRGELPWTSIDDLHRMILDEVLDQFGVGSLSELQKRRLNKVWHRLDAWPDSVEGLARLKAKFTICTLSNGNIGLLTNMAKNAGLPWDCILSAEVFRKYKPDPDTYLGVAGVFDLAPEEVMLVAAHHNDLAAARSCGLLTAYIERPTEFGSAQVKDVSPNSENTLHAENIIQLASMLV